MMHPWSWNGRPHTWRPAPTTPAIRAEQTSRRLQALAATVFPVAAFMTANRLAHHDPAWWIALFPMVVAGVGATLALGHLIDRAYPTARPRHEEICDDDDQPGY